MKQNFNGKYDVDIMIEMEQKEREKYMRDHNISVNESEVTSMVVEMSEDELVTYKILESINEGC